MGTEVSLIADPEAHPAVFLGALGKVASIFAREESRFSRFRDDSELTQVNRSAGGWIEVSAPFASVVRLALDGARETGGLFDPTVLGALEAAGYDRDFEAIERRDGTTSVAAVPCGRWREIEVIADRVWLPDGVGIDLGGLVKGWTADRAAEVAVDAGLGWAMVNAGGDLRLAGEGVLKQIGIEEPSDPEEVCFVVSIDGGALATTSVTRRRWGPELHHLIDPRIGLPARTPVVQATVWAPTCAAAEVASKRAALEGISALDDLPGVLILASGEIVTNLTAEVAA
jgi:thiamine biosynthesis lipoprotein